MKKVSVLLCTLMLFSTAVLAQKDALRRQLATIIGSHKSTIGVAVLGIEDGDTLTINDNHHYPMQSTFKFPLALKVLHAVDEGKLQLDQTIHVTKADLRKTWSPLRDKYPEGNIDLTLPELLEYTVSKSDNNTCDILFGLVGGPEAVNKYVHDLGVKNMAIAATEAGMATGWDVQYTNWVAPSAMTTLLSQFYKGKYLSPSNTKLLMYWMTASANSDKRIKGMLPAGTIVAHKTGSSDTNEKGLTAAINDIGIMALPNGKHVAIAVYVSNTTESTAEAEKTIAEMAKTIYDFYKK